MNGTIKNTTRSESGKQKNPFETLIEIYKDGVKKNDECGYAEKFKECADTFFRGINTQWVLESSNVHFEDIEYLDGYFIFGYGTNSVVHFHITECPGWKFGIWWNTPEAKDEKHITGELFAQYEETLDKFKPSNSELRASLDVVFGNAPRCDCYEAANMINFIRTEPYLAFCRDYCGWDYNVKYHSREEAKAKYDAYRIYHDNEVKYTKECDDKILAFVKENVLPSFVGAEICDNGENVSPRYEMLARFKDNTHIVDKRGCYGWFDENDEEDKAIMCEFNKLVKECEAVANEYEFMWFAPIDDSITFF